MFLLTVVVLGGGSNTTNGAPVLVFRKGGDTNSILTGGGCRTTSGAPVLVSRNCRGGQDFNEYVPPPTIESSSLKASLEYLWRPLRSLGKSLARILCLSKRWK